eukprot:TRINITY_DN24632_c0_g2_i1.p1 TRINITY_DN24632_c0_g2~~TRINITY_DN24632_c0_g2_i1.p1  ORF type:complete len:211 (-),score=31.42 TRINITY_DN24632_c0_g2_i1:55-687(-)
MVKGNTTPSRHRSPLTAVTTSSRRRSPGRRNTMLPKCVVFDLDGCVWHPDMYMLWNGGGAPFQQRPDGTLEDCGGNTVALHSGVRAAMNELVDDEKWSGVTVAAASCCDEPTWAHECLQKFVLNPQGRTLDDVLTIKEIHKGSKTGHLTAIAEAVGCSLEEIIFFDNEQHNCTTVATIGVTCIWCPGGISDEVWRGGLETFPKPGKVSRI